MGISDTFVEQRAYMVRWQIEARGIEDKAVLDAMRCVPRHLFVPEEYRSHAYDDSPLPLGHGQTISQPYMVARVLALLDVHEGARILEVGSGSGYLAAVLASMGAHVVALERIAALVEQSRKNLDRAGVGNVDLHVGDGRHGWLAGAPYDGMVISAASEKVEPAWMVQLAEGGRLVVPVAVGQGTERLLVRCRRGESREDAWYDYCRYVPLREGVEEEKGFDAN